MNTRLNAALVLAAALSLSGCINNDASVRIFGVCAIPSDAKCIFKSTCDALYIGDFTLDVSYAGTNFVWPIQVDNQRPDNANEDGATTTSTAWLEGYKLEFSSTTPGVAIAPTTVSVTSSPIQPKGSTVALASIIPPAVGAYLATQPDAQLTVKMAATGRYGDGTRFETGPLVVEVATCSGCVLPVVPPPGNFTPCDTTDPGPPPVLKPGQIANWCPQDGQTYFFTCK
jgi:hypothetical protein